MSDAFDRLRGEIIRHESNREHAEKGYAPLFTGSAEAKIMIVGQAPGIRAQTSGKPWNDASGLKLMQWLGVASEQFYDERLFAHIPMDFFYPGKGASGDLPPRKDFAPLWHPRLLALMPSIRLKVLIGRYSQKYYLPDNPYRTLTETIANGDDFLPGYLPLVHPSPLNFRWFARNPWFEQEYIPRLQTLVGEIIDGRDGADPA